MKQRTFALAPAAKQDLIDVWQLVYANDGPERADRLLARIEAFCRSLGEFSGIGTSCDHRRPGLRTVGVPRLSSVTILFLVKADTVTVIRIGYLGRNVVPELQHRDWMDEQTQKALASIETGTAEMIPHEEVVRRAAERRKARGK